MGPSGEAGDRENKDDLPRGVGQDCPDDWGHSEEYGPDEDQDGGRGQWLGVCSEYPEAAADQRERTQAIDKSVQLVELLVIVVA